MDNRCVAEISLINIENNYKIFKKIIGENKKIIAVVKANAYGHGAVKVATALEKIGCRDFAVSNLEEGLELRKGKIKSNILILGYTPIEKLYLVKKYNLIQTIISKEYLRDVIKSKVKIRAEFKIDTGMNRIGLKPNLESEKLLRKSLKYVRFEGIYTHLSCADYPSMDSFTSEQITKFKNFCNSICDLKFKYVHYQNSIGGVTRFDEFSTHVRLGIMLYGFAPNYDNELLKTIKPAMEFRARISMIKVIKKGESVGYGASYIASSRIKVATVSAGYADGIDRRLSNGGTVIVNGQIAKIIGKVCMDQFMIDVTKVKNVKRYDWVTIFNEQKTAEDLAKEIGTISYEILTNVSSRVKRVYRK